MAATHATTHWPVNNVAAAGMPVVVAAAADADVAGDIDVAIITI